MLDTLANVFCIETGFQGCKKLVFRIHSAAATTSGLMEVIHYTIASAGGDIKSGKPPMSALERVMQGKLQEEW